LPSADPVIPASSACLTKDETDGSSNEFDWLDTVMESIDGDGQNVDLSWAAFHADHDVQARPPNAIAALLPLFHHNAKKAAMMKHCLTVNLAAVHKLNPGHLPTEFGEVKFVILIGGLHIELAALRMLGHWLEASGRVQCLI
jgi:hypothetical protein